MIIDKSNICNVNVSQKPYEYIDSNGGTLKKIYDIVNNKFKIGDRVKVIDKGQFYSGYKQMIIAMGILEKDWMTCGLLNNDIGYIINVKSHEDIHDIIYGVKINDKVALISEKGLKKLQSLLPDRLFEI